MNSLGIYFGPKVISIVETKGRKVINSTQIPQSIISPGELEEKVPSEVKIIEIIALFKDELRRKRIEAKEATLCLSGKDLLIRTFEIPQMPREELQNAINFEAKRYIPFKVEDLVSAFQIEPDKQSHINLVLFMGIKKETLERYVSIFSQLEIKIKAIEYAAFSVLRCLKLAGLNDRGIIGILEADLQKEDEVNFTVIENGFPLFSRDISLAGIPEEIGVIKETAPVEALEKLKTEIRVSLDYYARKFSNKNIRKIYLLCNQDCYSELEAFIKEVGLAVQLIDITKCLDKSVPYSSTFIKSYSASLSKTIQTRAKVNLLAVKEKARLPRQGEIRTPVVSLLLKGLQLDFRMITLGVLICLATFGFGLYRQQPLHKELSSIISMRAQVATVNPEASYEELTGRDSEYKGKLNALDNLIRKQLYLTEPLNIIPRVIPKGVWLTHFAFNKQEDEKTELNLEGMVYLADRDKEFDTVNQFVAALKEDPDFSKYFKEINIVSIDSRQFEKMTVTSFLISCKTYKAKE